MRRATALPFVSLTSLLLLSACSEVVTTPGTTGTGGTETTGSTGGTGGISVGQSSSSTAASSSTGATQSYCILDEDCAGTPATPYCDETLTCVGCIPGVTKCAVGEYCDPVASACKEGCDTTAQCDQQLCDPNKHACVDCVDDIDCPFGTSCFASVCAQCAVDDDCPLGKSCFASFCVECVGDKDCPLGKSCFGSVCAECAVDKDCPLGKTCSASACVPGCSPTQSCPAAQTCCGSACVDLANSVHSCGGCNVDCFAPPHKDVFCKSGLCGVGACDAAYADCDGSLQNGCEHNVLMDGPCTCAPGSTQSCYQGAAGTKGVGPCKSGTQTCLGDGTGYGACLGQVLPAPEICGNGGDEDCSGVADDVVDQDGDGWTRCDGDCCDAPGQGCIDPTKVNPGAYEVLGNGVDDDCDPTTSEAASVDCGGGSELFAGVTGIEVAKAMDICRFTTASPPLAQRRWGLLGATQTLPDGSAPTAADLAAMQDFQTAIVQSFGFGGIVPKAGTTMAGLSTGRLRDVVHADYVNPAPGTSFGRAGQPPAAFLAAHGGALPGGTNCSMGACPSGTGAHDGVATRLSIRVPTNAKAFAYDFRFLSVEYGGRFCSPYNDFFLALLGTSAPGLPADKNIAFDVIGNLLSSNAAFYQACVPQGCSTCPLGTVLLAGTGFDVGALGGGTEWLTSVAPVVPGETMQLELMVFDVSDGIGDTAVLLDHFTWAPKYIIANDH